MTDLAMTLGDEEIQGLADSLMQIHAEVVRGKGLDLSRVVSPEKEEAIHGKIVSVAYSCFATVFDQTPSDRFPDVFVQVATFAQHFAKDHIFADGNKRTTVIACFSLLDQEGIEIAVPDSQDRLANEIYKAIQRLVTGAANVGDFADFLRRASSCRTS